MENLDKVYAESIAKEYSPKIDSKVVALKKLDRKAKQPAQIFAYTFGIIFSLVLGIGMCLAMHVIGPNDTTTFIIGIIIGVVGIAGISINYPLYKKILVSSKRKYASDIIELANDISKE